MRRLKFLLLLLFPFIICSCQHKFLPILSSIELQLETNPKSALQVLLDIRTTELSSNDKLYYTVLLSKATELNQKPLVSCDSLLNEVLRYKTSSLLYNQALFYKASIQNQMHLNKEAIYFYFQALHGLKKSREELQLASEIYSRLGDLYVNDRIFGKAEEMYESVFYYDSLIGDKSREGYIWWKMGQIRRSSQDTAAAVAYYRKALFIGYSHNDSLLISNVYSSLNRVYPEIEDSVDKHLRLALRYLPENEDGGNLYTLLGNLLNYRGQIDSARWCYDRAMKSTNEKYRSMAYFYTSYFEREHGNWSAAFDLMKRYTMCADSIYVRHQAPEIERLTYKYESELAVNKEQEENRVQLLLLCLSFIIVLFSGSIVLLHIRKRRKLVQLEYKHHIEILKEKINTLKTNIEAVSEEKIQLISDMKEQLMQLRSATFRQTKIYAKIEKLSKQNAKDRTLKVLTYQEQAELIRVVFEIYEDYIIDIQEQYSQPTEKDVLYLCLDACNFDTFTIALCLGNTDRQIVIQRKHRLKSKRKEE